MVKPFDVSKFRTSLTKGIKGLSVGFHDPTEWISTGNYALNYRISANFDWGIPMGKVTCLAGESGSGKSYIASGSIISNAQKQGIFVVLFDSENALDEKWLQALDVDTSPDKLLKLNVAFVNQVAASLAKLINEYEETPEEERVKILIVVDSLGMLLTPTDSKQFNKGDLKGDFGLKAKQITAMVKNCVNAFGNMNVGMITTNHTYASQDMFDPDDKISGGQGFIYASSIVIAMGKKKLKLEDSKTKVIGIKASCKIMKTRYSKPFETVDVEIPWETGMDAYSGLFELFEATCFERQGNRYGYTFINGDKLLEFRKSWTHEMFDNVMEDVMIRDMGVGHIHFIKEEIEDVEVEENNDG